MTKYYKLIKRLRRFYGYTQIYTANVLGMSRTSYIAVEKGTKELKLKEAIKASKLFQISLQELVDGKVQRELIMQKGLNTKPIVKIDLK